MNKQSCAHTAALFAALFLALIWKPVPVDAHELTFVDCHIILGPPVAKVHAGYCRIENPSAKTMSITGAQSSAYNSVELHRSVITNGVAAMESVRALEIAPGKTIILKSGGLHFMLMQPKDKLKPDAEIQTSIKLSDGTIAPIIFKTKAMGASHTASHKGHHDHMKHAK